MQPDIRSHISRWYYPRHFRPHRHRTSLSQVGCVRAVCVSSVHIRPIPARSLFVSVPLAHLPCGVGCQLMQRRCRWLSVVLRSPSRCHQSRLFTIARSRERTVTARHCHAAYVPMVPTWVPMGHDARAHVYCMATVSSMRVFTFMSSPCLSPCPSPCP